MKSLIFAVSVLGILSINAQARTVKFDCSLRVESSKYLGFNRTDDSTSFSAEFDSASISTKTGEERRKVVEFGNAKASVDLLDDTSPARFLLQVENDGNGPWSYSEHQVTGQLVLHSGHNGTVSTLDCQEAQ